MQTHKGGEKRSMKQYTREEVINLIDELLNYPEQLKSATTDENTFWHGDTLLNLIDAPEPLNPERL